MVLIAANLLSKLLSMPVPLRKAHTLLCPPLGSGSVRLIASEVSLHVTSSRKPSLIFKFTLDSLLFYLFPSISPLFITYHNYNEVICVIMCLPFLFPNPTPDLSVFGRQ